MSPVDQLVQKPAGALNGVEAVLVRILAMSCSFGRRAVFSQRAGSEDEAERFDEPAGLRLQVVRLAPAAIHCRRVGGDRSQVVVRFAGEPFQHGIRLGPVVDAAEHVVLDEIDGCLRRAAGVAWHCEYSQLPCHRCSTVLAPAAPAANRFSTAASKPSACCCVVGDVDRDRQRGILTFALDQRKAHLAGRQRLRGRPR